MNLAPSLREEMEAVAPQLLADQPGLAEHYGRVALEASAAAGVDSARALRVAAAATLLEWALVTHGGAPGVDAEVLLTADLRLAIAAEIAAEVGEPSLQAALAEAIMALAVGIAELPAGLGCDPRPVLSEIVREAAAGTPR